MLQLPCLRLPRTRVPIASRIKRAPHSLLPVHPKPLSAEYQTLLHQRAAVLRETLINILRGQDRITLEIGSGHGHFLTAYAAAHPSRLCLGIDIMSDRFERAEKKRSRAQLPNLEFVHASADCLLVALPEGVLLDDVIVLFPDPWPKRRHHKNRLIHPEFLGNLAAKAVPSARLCFRTDSSEYFNSAQAIITAHPAWAIALTALWPFEMPTVFQSRARTYESLVAIRR